VDTNDMLILIEGWRGAASKRFTGPFVADAASSLIPVPEPASTLAWLVPAVTAIAGKRRRGS
jgi:hypothetical protein